MADQQQYIDALEEELRSIKDVMARVGLILGLEPNETHTDGARRVVDGAGRLLDENKRLKAKVREYRSAAFLCLTTSGEERDDAVRDMDLIRGVE